MLFQVALEHRVDSSTFATQLTDYEQQMTAARSALGADEARIQGVEDHVERLTEATGV
jgi:hypothetical protein